MTLKHRKVTFTIERMSQFGGCYIWKVRGVTFPILSARSLVLQGTAATEDAAIIGAKEAIDRVLDG